MKNHEKSLEGKAEKIQGKKTNRRDFLGRLGLYGIGASLFASVPLSCMYNNIRDIRPVSIDRYQYVTAEELLSDPKKYAGQLIEIEDGKILTANVSHYDPSFLYRATSSRDGRTQFRNTLELMLQLKDGPEVMLFDFDSDFSTDSYKEVEKLLKMGNKFTLRGRLENASSDRFQYLATYGHSIDLEDENGRKKTFYLSDRHAGNIPETDMPY